MSEETKIQILPELKNCLPPLDDQQRKSLAEGIARDGMLYGILLCEIQGLPGRFIVDGHTRYEIAHEIGIAPAVHTDDVLHFGSVEEAVCWIIEHQTTRRNLTEQQFKAIVAKHYIATRAMRGGDRKSEKSKDQNEPSISAAEKTGRMFGVSPASVKRFASDHEKIESLGLQPAVNDCTIKNFEAAALNEIIDEVEAEPERQPEIVRNAVETARANNGRLKSKRPGKQQSEPNAEEEDPQADRLLLEITNEATELIHRARRELDKTRLTKLRSAMHEAFKRPIPDPVGSELI